MTYICDLKEGTKFEGEWLLVNCTKGVSSNGQPYLNLTFQDKTGSIEAKKWEATEYDIGVCVIGTIVKVYADIIDYRGVFQARVSMLEKIDQNKIDYTNFCMPSPVSQEELVRKLQRYINSIQNDVCKKVVDVCLKRHYDEFISYPAASRNHHEFASGLLFHTVSMLDLGSAIQNLYPTLSRDLLLTGIILHDVGKTIELSGPIATKYTLEGKLLGHISIMLGELRYIQEKENIHSEVMVLLEHMILSHHGEQEFGSPVPPLTKEAFALHMIDDFDAKMIMIDKALDNIKEGEFSQRIPSLDGRAFYKHSKV